MTKSTFWKAMRCLGLLLALNQIGHKLKAQFLEVDTTHYIAWDEFRTLSWDDYTFKNVQKEGYAGMAMTSVLHSVRGGMLKKKPYFEVNVLFVKEDSWTSDTTSLALFEHEKLHFDIAELYARKIRGKMAALGSDGEKDIGVYRKWVQVYLDEYKRFSNSYDKSTTYGQNRTLQIQWNDDILRALQELAVFRWEGRK